LLILNTTVCSVIISFHIRVEIGKLVSNHVLKYFIGNEHIFNNTFLTEFSNVATEYIG
jgi:hypothetical protein